MGISKEEFRLLVDAFQFMLNSFPNDPENDLLYQQTEDFLSRVDHQANYRFSLGEIDNCVIALQLFCAKSPAVTDAHRALLLRFVSLQMRNF